MFRIASRRSATTRERECVMKTVVHWSLLWLTLSCANCATGAPLIPGSVLMPAPDEGLPAGRLARQVVAPFAIPGGVSGTLTTTAYERDTTSLLGGVTVTYLLEVVDGPAGDSISRMSVGQVIGFATDVSIAHLDPGVTPAFIDRDVSGGFIGATFHTSPLDENANFLTPGFHCAACRAVQRVCCLERKRLFARPRRRRCPQYVLFCWR